MWLAMCAFAIAAVLTGNNEYLWGASASWLLSFFVGTADERAFHRRRRGPTERGD